MHTRRVASFLLGVWLGCSLFMGFIAVENLRSPNLVLNGPIEPAAKILQSLAPDEARQLLRHLAAEQNRLYFSLWEDAEIPLAFLVGGCLFLATQKRIFPVVFCALMLVLVLFEHFAITPELAYRGRAADFPPGSLALGSQARVWALSQVYVGVEGVKLVVGGILASYLFAFRARRRAHRETDAIDRADHSHVDL